MNRIKKVLSISLLIITSPVWAGNWGYYKGDTGGGRVRSERIAIASCGGGESSCAGSLSCNKPISRMSCTDQYCFYPPAETMSQARCCRYFGNMGALGDEDP